MEVHTETDYATEKTLNVTFKCLHEDLTALAEVLNMKVFFVFFIIKRYF